MKRTSLSPNYECRHKNQSLIVVEGFAEWEETAIICMDCKNKI